MMAATGRGNKMFSSRIGGKRGFTLLELMISIAVISILSVVVMIHVRSLIRRADEGATKANLGVLRWALSVYYGENEGLWPVSLDALVSSQAPEGSKGYINEIPEARTGINAHAPGREVINSGSDYSGSDEGLWWYNTSSGRICVACSHNDSKDENIGSW